MRRLLTIAAVLLLAAPAAAASRFEVVADCADDSRLQGDYTVAELRDARRNLQAEAEYTDCADVLRRAELALLERRESAGPRDSRTGTATLPQPAALVPADDAERAALREARAEAPAAVPLRGRAVEPGRAGFAPAAVRNELPGSLLAVLFSLALLGAWALWGFVRRGTGEAMGNDLWRPIP